MLRGGPRQRFTPSVAKFSHCISGKRLEIQQTGELESKRLLYEASNRLGEVRCDLRLCPDSISTFSKQHLHHNTQALSPLHPALIALIRSQYRDREDIGRNPAPVISCENPSSRS